MYQSFISILLCCLCSVTVVGQKPTLYTYRFKQEIVKDVSSVQADTLIQESNLLKGRIVYKAEPVPFATIQLKGKDTILWAMSDTAGYFALSLTPEAYLLTATSVNYMALDYAFIMPRDRGLLFKINLAPQQPLTWYTIKSARPLMEGELENIKKCVTANEGKPINCNKRNVYWISLEI